MMRDASEAESEPDMLRALVARDGARIATELLRGPDAGNGTTDPFAAAVRATRMPMIVTDPRQADNPVVFANNAFFTLSGYTPQEVIGRNCRFLQGPETDPATIERIRSALRAGTSIEIDLRNYRKGGEPFWNRLLIAPVRDGAGEIAYFVASQVDITVEWNRLARLESHYAALTAELAHQVRRQRDSDARLRFATDAGRLGIWEVDLRDETLTASPMFKEICGFERSATLTFEDLQRHVHPDDLPTMRIALERSLGSGADYDIDYRVLRPDGALTWVQIRAQVRTGPDGEALLLSGIALDITRRRAAELRLELSEQSLRLATEAAEIGTWDLDLATDLLTWSDRTRAMFGISAGAAIARPDFYRGLHPDDVQSTSMAFAAALDPATRSAYDVEYRTIGREDGAVRWVASKGRGLFEGDRCVRALGTAIDISARKRAEARQAFLLALGDRLRDLADDPVAMITAASEALARRLAAPRVGYVGVDDTIGFSTVAQTWNDVSRVADSAARRTPLAAFGVPRLSEIRAGRMIRVDEFGGLATLATPVRRNRRTVAFVFVQKPAGREAMAAWTDDDAELTREVAERTWEAVEQARAQAAVRELNATLEARVAERTAERDRMWRLSTSIMMAVGVDGIIAAVNPAWTTVLGWGADEVTGASYHSFVHPDDLDHTLAHGDRLRGALMSQPFENRNRHKDGSFRWLSWTAVPDGDVIHAVARDVTAEKAAAQTLARTEEQLRQAQKMEAVGQLTGGIAHDFNNLLTGVIGALELLQRRVTEGRFGDLQRYTEAASASASRAAALTQRLLAFARRQPLDPKPVAVDALIGGMEELLRRTLGPGITLDTHFASGLWPILCDPNQLESAILNLAINARDAMPDGGQLTVTAANMQPGEHVEITVGDTGTGMDPEIVARVFEPFFTTKPIGQGTGLGLSMVYGFVNQSGGEVRLESEVGAGTMFRLCLPRHLGALPAGAGAQAGAQAGAEAGTEPKMTTIAAWTGARVLVVEDEPAVRMLVVDILGDLGCSAIQAGDAASGLSVLQSDTPLDLLITDVGLPAGLNGRQLADAARAIRPELKILFVTGFAGGAVGGREALDAGMEMLTKPFSMKALAAKVRGLIGGA